MSEAAAASVDSAAVASVVSVASFVCSVSVAGAVSAGAALEPQATREDTIVAAISTARSFFFIIVLHFL